jgi:hypothetical protein
VIFDLISSGLRPFRSNLLTTTKFSEYEEPILVNAIFGSGHNVESKAVIENMAVFSTKLSFLGSYFDSNLVNRDDDDDDDDELWNVAGRIRVFIE